MNESDTRSPARENICPGARAARVVREVLAAACLFAGAVTLTRAGDVTGLAKPQAGVGAVASSPSVVQEAKTASSTRTVPSEIPAADTKPALAPATRSARDARPPRAARSVHLAWDAPAGTDFYNELTVDRTTPGTYFMACGFGHGYFGMQDLNGKPNGLAGDGGKTDKVVLFSIWDPYKGDDAKAVPDEKRVEVLASGDGVRLGRFGGEGTGGQSFFTYPWAVGETCRFLVRARPEGDKTAFSGYFYRNDTKAWQHLATFRTVTGGKPLGGYYSFVEDFRRDGKSRGERREAQFGNGWVRSIADGAWVSLDRARFTGDRTPLDNVDAGLTGAAFYLFTGGDVANHLKLGGTVVRPPTAGATPPADLPPGP
jgi:hypothetical protein